MTMYVTKNYRERYNTINLDTINKALDDIE